MESFTDLTPTPPVEITNSLKEFRRDYPNPLTVGFLMMQFDETRVHGTIVRTIKSVAKEHGIHAVRADEKAGGYHSDGFWNVMTCIYGSAFGIAVFERLQDDLTNPNVAFELGCMYAVGKPVCLLKERTVRSVPADLMSKLYIKFDAQDPENSIRGSFVAWLRDKGLVTSSAEETGKRTQWKQWITVPHFSKAERRRLKIKQEILALVQQGYNTRQIARKLRQTENDVSWVCRLHGLPPTGGSGRAD